MQWINVHSHCPHFYIQRAIELHPGDSETYVLVIESLIAIGDGAQQAREGARRTAALLADSSDRVIIDIQLVQIVKYRCTVYP